MMFSKLLVMKKRKIAVIYTRSTKYHYINHNQNTITNFTKNLHIHKIICKIVVVFYKNFKYKI